MSNTTDTGGFFSKILSFIFGSSGTTEPADHDITTDPAHGSHDHGMSESKLKLVASQSEESLAEITGKIPTGPILASGIENGDREQRDSSFLLRDMVLEGQSPVHEHPANQNIHTFVDHLPAFTDPNFANLNTFNDDVLTTSGKGLSEAPSDLGRIFSSDTVPFFDSDINNSFVANDAGHSVVLDASDILSMGNNLIITGNALDSVNFQDEGWTKIDFTQPQPFGIEPREGFDTFIHDSGAIVQIDSLIQTTFDFDGLR